MCRVPLPRKPGARLRSARVALGARAHAQGRVRRVHRPDAIAPCRAREATRNAAVAESRRKAFLRSGVYRVMTRGSRARVPGAPVRPMASLVDEDCRPRPSCSKTSHARRLARAVWGPISKGQRMDRRRFLIGTAAAAFAATPAFAQEAFPSHAITIINAFPPGGVNDIVTRPLATAMEPILKQPVVVETKAGAAGQVGAQFVAAAKPDR